jgi:hypothetical protein
MAPHCDIRDEAVFDQSMFIADDVKQDLCGMLKEQKSGNQCAGTQAGVNRALESSQIG